MFPSWVQFLDEEYEAGYGFPHHDWDQPQKERNKAVKIGTMAKYSIDTETIRLNKVKFDPIPNTDYRVKAA